MNESSQKEFRLEVITEKPTIPSVCNAGNVTYDNSTKLYSINGLSLIDSVRGKNRSFSSKPNEYNCFIDGYTRKWPEKAVCDYGSISFEFPEDLMFETIVNFAKFERLRKHFMAFHYHIEKEWDAYWRESSVRKNMAEHFAKRFDELPFVYKNEDLYKLFD